MSELRDINGIKFVVGDVIMTSNKFTSIIIDIYNGKIITNSDSVGVVSYTESDIKFFNIRIIDPMKQRALDKNGDMVQVGDKILHGGDEYKITDIIKSNNGSKHDCVRFYERHEVWNKGWDFSYSNNCALVKPKLDKVKVSIGNETGYISAESAKEFKRMLRNV
jgi:hypothetical protein